MRRNSISAFIAAIAAISLLMPTEAQGQRRDKPTSIFRIEKDSVPMLRGFALSVDLVGPLMMALGDYGQYEGALRLNLHDQFFPIVELGYGKADHRNELNTGITYRTKAPYGRIGIDINVLKRKHTGNRAFVGLRYAYTNYKVDIFRDVRPDPVWKWPSEYAITNSPNYMHWMEALFGIDAKIAGPIHLGWTVRMKKKLFTKDVEWGQPWYVPGFGIYGSMRLGGTFNVIIDI